jgi:hypothetical protein
MVVAEELEPTPQGLVLNPFGAAEVVEVQMPLVQVA